IKEMRTYIDDMSEAKKYEQLAYHDPMTGCLNRLAWAEIIRGADIENHSGVVIMFDLNDLKVINDTKGHLAGDMVLKNVAKNIDEIFPKPQHRVFRIGGDEFSVITKGISENEIIDRLIVLRKNLEMDGNISLSKGYSIIKGNPEEAFKYADEMLYADKMSKKKNNAIF
ncbi:MAG: GGDEF domain-containing protein, partial [Clostridia bacterium]|nr:GGDEF domain-containing protein [Clostridia bacterium]